MDKRSLFALALIALVIVGGQLLMPRSPESAPVTDTARARDTVARHDAASPPAPPTGVSPQTKHVVAPAVSLPVRESSGIPAETLAVSASERTARFVTPGAGLLD